MRKLEKEIAEIKQMLQVNNLLPLEEAAKLIGRAPQTMKNRKSEGVYVLGEHYKILETGEVMFFKDKILK